MVKKLNAKQLRQISPKKAQQLAEEVARQPLYFILENIYDTYNVGSLFRLADALAVKKIFLIGQTETPPNPKIVKASVGTYKIVPWEYQKTTLEAIRKLKKETQNKIQIVAVEQTKQSLPYTQAEYRRPLALILGHETLGLKRETIEAADQVVEIPLYGLNRSLNVLVAAAIVAYWTVSHLTPRL